MKKITTILLCAFGFFQLHSQTDSSMKTSTGENPANPVVERKKAPYLATVKTMEGKSKRGYVYQVNEDQVVLIRAKSKDIKGWRKDGYVPTNTIYLPAADIKSISVQKKGSTLKGLLIGLGVGTVTGIVIGFASGDDPIRPYPSSIDDPLGLETFLIAIENSFAMKASEKAIANGILMGGSGALIGAIIGTVARKKFIIGGRKEKVRDLQASLMQRLILK